MRRTTQLIVPALTALLLTSCGSDQVELAIGEPTTAEVDAPSGTAPLEVTLTELREAGEDEIPDGAQAPVYFLTYEVTNTEGADFGDDILPLRYGLLEDGSAVQNISTFEDFEPCPNVGYPGDFASEGATFTTCQAVSGADGEVVGGNLIPSDVNLVVEWTE